MNPIKADYYLIKIICPGGDPLYESNYVNVKSIGFIIRQGDDPFSSKTDVIIYLKATHSLLDKLQYIKDLKKYIVRIWPHAGT